MRRSPLLDASPSHNRPPADRSGRASPNGTEASQNPPNPLRRMNVPTAASTVRLYPGFAPRPTEQLGDSTPSRQPYWPHEKRPRFQHHQESASPLALPPLSPGPLLDNGHAELSALIKAAFPEGGTPTFNAAAFSAEPAALPYHSPEIDDPAMYAPTPPALQDSEALGAIWHADVELPTAVRDLASAYAEGIDNDYTQAYITANQIIWDTRAFLKYGSSNQRWNGEKADRMKEATKRVAFLEDCSATYLPEVEVDRFAWSPRNKSGEAGELAFAIRSADADEPQAETIERARQVLLRKPRLRARLAIAVQAGDDNHMAEVAYWLARERFGADHTVQLAEMPGHMFCLVGKDEWPRDDWWVIDPWPRDAYPVQLKHHLSGGNISVIVGKPGKHGRPPTEQSMRKAKEEEVRRDRIRAAMTRGLEAFQPDPAPKTGQQRVMHNSLYPTREPTRQIYTVLIRHSNEMPRSMRYIVSAEHEHARLLAERIIRDVKSGLEYGSSNQLWNSTNAGRAEAHESHGRSNGADVGAGVRIPFLRSADAHHLSKQELKRFAQADHKGWEYRVDLADKIKRALQPDPGAGGANPTASAEAKSALGKVSRDALFSKPRLSAYAALGVQAGNCGECASLAYTLARQRFDPAYTVMYASTLIPEHAFCIVGKNTWHRDDWWVIDAWPRDAYPVLVRHYLARRNISVVWSKPAKGSSHSAEKEKRYEQLRSDVARRFGALVKAQREQPQQSAAGTETDDPSTYLYNCLYPTVEPIRWTYEVAPETGDG